MSMLQIMGLVGGCLTVFQFCEYVENLMCLAFTSGMMRIKNQAY